jgi:hypothetical protein
MIPRAMPAVAYATGRASHARQVKGDDPDKKGYPGPPGWGFGVGLTTSHSKKLIVTKVEQRRSWMDLTMMERVGDRWEKNGRILFDRPKPTVGCSASGRRRSDTLLLNYIQIANIDNIQSNITQLVILLRCIAYIVSFNDMFRL